MILMGFIWLPGIASNSESVADVAYKEASLPIAGANILAARFLGDLAPTAYPG
jgi:hypothetical protein